MTRALATLILGALIASLTTGVGCATATPAAPTPPAPAEQADDDRQLVPTAKRRPPPFVAPPDKTDEIWQIPGYGLASPAFPFLPDEADIHTRSVGTTSDGYLINGRPLPLPHPHLAVLPRQFERRIIYTGDPVIALLEDAADHLEADYPDQVIYVGNFSRPGGGAIPYSVSHQSGRDADVAFFVTDDDGTPVVPPDLMPLDQQGRYESPDEAPQENSDNRRNSDDAEADATKSKATPQELVLNFDAPRNWRFIEGLLTSSAAQIQYIFVSNPLRRMLLEEARRQGADAEIIADARRVLVQPGGHALPHNDHYHIRIHCTARDLAAGCRETGAPGPAFDPDYGLRNEIIDRAQELLSHDHPHWRRVAIERLAMLDGHTLQEDIVALIDDPEPRVRAAAIRAVASEDIAVDALANRLPREESPAVLAELIDALTHHDRQALSPLTEALQRRQPLALAPGLSTSIDALAADALARLERPEPVPDLIDALATSSPPARPAIAHALRILTNHRFVSDEHLRTDAGLDDALQAWRDWYDEHGHQERRQWLAEGFQQAGFAVDDLGKNDVWELCRAIMDHRHLNFNAQRTLQRISGQSPPSLRWSPYDANFYWRRWFERRQQSFSLPPIPDELSTADGYTPPDDAP